MTSMPNRFNHATQDEASLIIGSFAPLMNINCSADLPFLLCSMYTPICVPDYPRAIQGSVQQSRLSSQFAFQCCNC